MTSSRLLIGQRGEAHAADYLKAQGYTLYARNVRLGQCEIDIIAFDPQDRAIVFVEVKSRKSAISGFHPSLNLTYKKKRAMYKAGMQWLLKTGVECGYRFDLVCVAAGRVVQHVEGLAMSSDSV